MTKHQIALLIITASAVRDMMDPASPGHKTIGNAIDDVAVRTRRARDRGAGDRPAADRLTAKAACRGQPGVAVLSFQPKVNAELHRMGAAHFTMQ